MTSTTNLEDLESAAEFERIKRNFKSTVISTDGPANIFEAQAALQDIQYELQEFILRHLSRTVALQRTISSHFHLDSLAPDLKIGNSNVHGTVTSKAYPSASRQSDVDPNVIVDAVSHQAICNHGVTPSRRASASPPLENHLRSLSGFLNVHVENLHALQNSLRSTAGNNPVTTVRSAVLQESALPAETNKKFYDALTQQFNMLVVISTFTAGLIVSFLSLVYSLIKPSHQTPFNVGMLFSFFALSLHFGNIIVAGRGAAITTQQHHAGWGKEYDSKYFRHYLSVCEQLQFSATLLFVVSILVLTFYIFSSLAYPLVLMFTTALGAFLVFWSVYWKVSITLRNLKFLVKNFRRLGWQTLGYLKTREGQHT